MRERVPAQKFYLILGEDKKCQVAVYGGVRY